MLVKVFYFRRGNMKFILTLHSIFGPYSRSVLKVLWKWVLLFQLIEIVGSVLDRPLIKDQFTGKYEAILVMLNEELVTAEVWCEFVGVRSVVSNKMGNPKAVWLYTFCTPKMCWMSFWHRMYKITSPKIEIWFVAIIHAYSTPFCFRLHE